MAAPGNMRSAIVTAAVMIAGSLAWVAGISLAGLEASRGFFGAGPLIADANLILEIFLVAGITYGFLLARRGNIERDQADVEDDPGRLVDLVRVDVAAPREQEPVGDPRDEEDLENQVGVGDQRARAEEAARGLEPRQRDPRDPGERASDHDGGRDDCRTHVAGCGHGSSVFSFPSSREEGIFFELAARSQITPSARSLAISPSLKRSTSRRIS